MRLLIFLRPSLTIVFALTMVSGSPSLWHSSGPKTVWAANQAAAGQASPDSGEFDDEAEQALVQRMNEERKRQGLRPMANDERLRDAARRHSLLIAGRHVLSHGFEGEPDLPKRLAGTGVRFDRSGENVAFGPTEEAAHTGLMNSPQHRANILHAEFNAAGIGVARRDGQLWVTQDFVRRLEFHSVEEAEDILAGRFETLRRQSGQPPLERLPLKELRQLACKMADQNQLNTRAALQLVGSGSAVAFTSLDLSGLPPSAGRAAARPALARYSVGVCFQESEQYPSGAYWVLMVVR